MVQVTAELTPFFLTVKTQEFPTLGAAVTYAKKFPTVPFAGRMF